MLGQFILGGLLSVVIAYPDAGLLDGKSQAANHARGVPNGHRFIKDVSKSGTIPNFAGSESNLINTYAGNDFGGAHGGAEPTKTFYVNVPQENHPIPPPIAAGPPRKHYRIVFIRSPSPPPPQQILPPKVEQKTLIYVLHPRPQGIGQEVVEVPNVQHDPQVYFVQYENEPPTPQDLQNLVKNTLDGEGGANFNFGGPSGPSVIAGAPSPAPVYPPGGFQGNNIQYKRGAPEQAPKTFKPQAAVNVPTFEDASKTKKASNERSPTSTFETQRNRKRPQVFPARGPSSNRRSDTNVSVENEKASGANSAVVPTPEFRTIFGDTFDNEKPLRFGGKLKPRTPAKEVQSSIDEGRSRS